MYEPFVTLRLSPNATEPRWLEPGFCSVASQRLMAREEAIDLRSGWAESVNEALSKRNSGQGIALAIIELADQRAVILSHDKSRALGLLG